jgi:hypothetical protein
MECQTGVVQWKDCNLPNLECILALISPPRSNVRHATPKWRRARVLLAAALLAIIGVCGGALLWSRVLHLGFNSDCAMPGQQERLVIGRFLESAAGTRGYDGLFDYFLTGFRAHASRGGARIRYCGAASDAGLRVNALEGFARTAPLFAAWLYSGRPARFHSELTGEDIDLIAVLRNGILAGVDRDSADYWGDIAGADQRRVEAADIARTLWLTKPLIWDHLQLEERQKILRWLAPAGRFESPRNNWALFPIIVTLVVAQLEPDGLTEARIAGAREQFAAYRRLYRESGWFNDPPTGVDFYNTWAISYELFWINKLDPHFDSDFITTAIASSGSLTEHLISPRGIPIMGRSICYRTAVPVPVLAVQLVNPANEPGRARRALDVVWSHFLSRGVLRDGALSQGYYQPDLRFLDRYSGPGSCHWGLRSLTMAFLFAADDPFWTVQPGSLPVEERDYRIELPLLGWRVTGEQRSGNITIEILANETGRQASEQYTWTDRVTELLTHRSRRPHNHEVKYESRTYSVSEPFPMY